MVLSLKEFFQSYTTQTMIFILVISIIIFISQMFLYDNVEGSYSLLLFENSDFGIRFEYPFAWQNYLAVTYKDNEESIGKHKTVDFFLPAINKSSGQSHLQIEIIDENRLVLDDSSSIDKLKNYVEHLKIKDILSIDSVEFAYNKGYQLISGKSLDNPHTLFIITYTHNTFYSLMFTSLYDYKNYIKTVRHIIGSFEIL